MKLHSPLLVEEALIGRKSWFLRDGALGNGSFDNLQARPSQWSTPVPS